MSGWATSYIEQLRTGKRVSFRPTGSSMEPLIMSKQLVTVEPVVDHSLLRKGDIVLCTVEGRQYLHKIIAEPDASSNERFLIGNNRGGTNGWTSARNIHGVLVKEKRKKKLKCTVYKDFCMEHNFVHGAEAEELREGIEKIRGSIARNYDDDFILMTVLRQLDDLVERVDARDSLAFLEAKDEEE